MLEALKPTQDPGWVPSYEGYSVLDESVVDSRLGWAATTGTHGARDHNDVQVEWVWSGTRRRWRGRPSWSRS